MKHVTLWPACRLALLLSVSAAVLATGCASGSAGSKDDPAKARAEALKKLSPEEITKAGDAAVQSGDYSRAITSYMQALEIAPTAALWVRVGWIYARMGRAAQAAHAYQSAVQLDEKNAGAHEELALILLRNKQRESAEPHFRSAIELDATRWRSHNALGVLADAAGDHRQAVQHFEGALAARPASALVLNNLGYSWYLAGDLDRALEYYQQALGAKPEYRAATTNVALVQARRREYDLALETLSGVMEVHRARNDVGYIAFQNGDLVIAERLLSEAVRLAPSWYATAHENLERVREALQSSG